MSRIISVYNGEPLDRVTGAIHLGNGYRAYHPALMRFQCPDSWSPFSLGGINPYAYCAGDPLNRTDPSGHFSLGQEIGLAIGLVAGIALSILTEGAAMPVVLTLMATVAGDSAIGAGTELVTQAVDRKSINWGQLGIAAGLSAATSLAGYGVGMASRFKGTSNRPFSGLMMESREMHGKNIAKDLSKEERMRNVQRILIHDLDEDSGEIISYRQTHLLLVNETVFVNEYSPNAWIFLKNVRHNYDPFFASDVIEHQYNLVSKENNFSGIMPRKLVYDKLLNGEALTMLEGKSGGDLTNSFLESGLGKSTMRALQHYNLHIEFDRTTFFDGDLTLYLKEDPRQLT